MHIRAWSRNIVQQETRMLTSQRKKLILEKLAAEAGAVPGAQRVV
ncbi:hypothetical protein BN134_2036 [Cronobacter dublinensis 1210]|uniref:Uncharacterized protein n=1 Tax=Cronobacter dublinensis 1210 TaxID=1208656 RepID=A0ABP1W761_9ENTR|nr:hypothetical protein BN134_2036 [Cronobacter dublinensis 1210]